MPGRGAQNICTMCRADEWSENSCARARQQSGDLSVSISSGANTRLRIRRASERKSALSKTRTETGENATKLMHTHLQGPHCLRDADTPPDALEKPKCIKICVRTSAYQMP